MDSGVTVGRARADADFASDDDFCRLLNTLTDTSGFDPMHHAERVSLAKNGLVRETGRGSDVIYFVVHGEMALQFILRDGRRQGLAFRYAGDLLCSNFNRHLPEVSARALSDLELLRFDRQALTRLVSGDSALARALIVSAARQMECSIVHNLLLGRLSTEEKVVSFLFETALRLGRPMADGVMLVLPMTRDDIADYLGLNSNVVSRTFSKLRRGGLLASIRGNEVLVRDVERLKAATPIADALASNYGQGLGGDWLGRVVERVRSRPASACPVHLGTGT